LIYIGIDPGVSGGIGVIQNDIGEGAHRVEAFKMPVTEMDLYELLKKQIYSWHLKTEVFCYLEKSPCFPRRTKGH